MCGNDGEFETTTALVAESGQIEVQGAIWKSFCHCAGHGKRQSLSCFLVFGRFVSNYLCDDLFSGQTM